MSLNSSATANPVLSSLLNKYLVAEDGFVGQRIAPLFLTAEQAANYYVFDKDNALQIPRLGVRAPGTSYPRTSMKLSQDSYGCINRGLEIPVDDEERAKYRSAFDADSAAIRRIRNIIRVNHEVRIKEKIEASAAGTSSPSVKWDAYTNAASDPIGDVQAAKDAIFEGCGMDPNLMTLPRAVFNKLKEHPQILDKVKYSQRGVITREILEEIFGIRIAVAQATENSAADGQTITPEVIWGEVVVLAVVNPTQDLQAPNFLRTFVWTGQTGPDGVTVETYREDKIQSDVHRGKQHTDEKITGVELGYYFTNTLT
jgi:hypothetical protein